MISYWNGQKHDYGFAFVLALELGLARAYPALAASLVMRMRMRMGTWEGFCKYLYFLARRSWQLRCCCVLTVALEFRF